jgi:hypothetical protein
VASAAAVARENRAAQYVVKATFAAAVGELDVSPVAREPCPAALVVVARRAVPHLHAEERVAAPLQNAEVAQRHSEPHHSRGGEDWVCRS